MRGIGRSPEHTYKKICDLYLEGVPNDEIAELCGCDLRTVVKTIGRVAGGGTFLPPGNAGKRYANRRLTPELVHLLEDLYAQKEDLFVDEARDLLQRFSVPHLSDEIVRRELRLLGMTNKKVRS